VKGWRLSVAERFDRGFGDNEAVRCAFAANLAYYHYDPGQLWWVFFAVAQGGYLGSGSRYIRGGSRRLSHALARAVKSAGGEILLERLVTEIAINQDGRPSAVVHEHCEGGERVEVRAPIVISNAAPAVVANMLPPSARGRFWAPYAKRPLSISLFSATFGLSTLPTEIGFKRYSTLLLPKWMTRLTDHRRSGELMAGMPGDAVPPMALGDYSAIDSGLCGPPYQVSAVGVDPTANWSGLDGATYDAKRDRWREAVLGAIDASFRALPPRSSRRCSAPPAQ
jgi:phytoene dehydrogenase-like protein